MKITITLTDEESITINSIAEKEGLTAGEYAANIVKNFLGEQIRGVYRKKFNEKSVEELADIFGKVTKEALR